jgi:hypothetical protein
VIPVPPLATGSAPVTPVVSDTLVTVLSEPLIVCLLAYPELLLATSVSVAVGRVTVPVLVIVEMTGDVSALLVRACDPCEV